jgi:hypothetical protein
MLDEHGFDELVRDNGHRKGTRRHDATSSLGHISVWNETFRGESRDFDS